MSLDTPTTKELSDNIISQLEAAFGQSISLLPKSFMRVLAKVLAGLFIILYKYGGYIFLQMFVQSASAKDTTVLGVTVNPLTFWGRLIGIGDPVAATNAELTIDITVETQTGYIESGVQLLSALNGVTYITLGSTALDAATVEATVKAVSDQAGGGGAGDIGNLEDGSTLSFANPLANVARDTTVTGTTVTGADGESVENYRSRIVDKFQKRPQGGAYSDYVLWGLEVAGIINIYPYTSSDPGQVDVYVEATVESSGDPDGIPTTAQLEAVLDSINFDQNGLASRRPAGALANTYAIERTAFGVVVNDLIVDNQAEVEDDITAGIEEYFLDREPYIVGLSIAPRRDRITNSGVSGVVDDIVSAAAGEFSSVTLLDVNSDPLTEYTLGEGEKAKADPVTYP